MVSIAIVGAGFSGIGAAASLLSAGHTDLVVFERSDDVGGVWRENTYPGAACDVPSHLYSFSFAPDGRWSKRFAEQSEILGYLQRVARELGVLPLIRFGTGVERCDWDDVRKIWTLALSSGQAYEAQVVITACGQLSRPSVPALPGIEDFDGPVFHSAQWRHDVDLAGKRVLVVGTGASAIQFVPEIAKTAAQVTVLQRSAPWVLRKPDRAYGPRSKRLLKDHPGVLQADRLRTFLQNEVRSVGFNTEPRLLTALELTVKLQIARSIPASERSALVPDYQIGCKRILQSNDWYPALARPTVTVTTSGIRTVTATGAVLEDGTSVAADVIVLGTGFEATRLLVPLEITARGTTLEKAWADGPEAYLGTVVAGFPNLFLMYGPNTNLGHNSIILMLESQLRWILEAVNRLPRDGSLEVSEQAQSTYNAWLQRRLARTVFARGCRSWYLTDTGKNTQNWPGSTIEFRLRTRRLKESDVLVRS